MEATITRIEVIIIESEDDLAELSAEEGIEIHPGEECAHCQAELDDLPDDDFEPFVVVVDEDDSYWAVCYDCSLPLVEPENR
jgi:hypothetical protein